MGALPRWDGVIRAAARLDALLLAAYILVMGTRKTAAETLALHCDEYELTLAESFLVNDQAGPSLPV